MTRSEADAAAGLLPESEKKLSLHTQDISRVESFASNPLPGSLPVDPAGKFCPQTSWPALPLKSSTPGYGKVLQ